MSQTSNKIAELRNSYLTQLQEVSASRRTLEAQLEQLKMRQLQLQGAVAGLDELNASVNSEEAAKETTDGQKGQSAESA